jgi:hypothetical protein
MFRRTTSRAISAEEHILRAHWEWSRRYAMLWIIGTSIIFAGIFAMLEIVGAGERVQVPSLILLLAITTINAIWRAAGALAARIEIILMSNRHA